MKMFKKLQNKKGFTLMEMLIVVAIIVILVAVSIPVFTSQLDNAKKAADDANLRAAKSVALTQWMAEGKLATKVCNADVTVYYDITDGKLVESAPSGAGDLGQSKANAGKPIYVIYTHSSGDIKVQFGPDVTPSP